MDLSKFNRSHDISSAQVKASQNSSQGKIKVVGLDLVPLLQQKKEIHNKSVLEVHTSEKARDLPISLQDHRKRNNAGTALGNHTNS